MDDPDPKQQPELPQNELEKQSVARGRIQYAADIDTWERQRLARAGTRRSRSLSRDSMSIRKSAPSKCR